MMEVDGSDVRRAVMDLAGAEAAGIAAVAEVDEEARGAYRRWIGAGHHGPMSYMDRYHEVRGNPALLLDGARAIIVAAFNYRYPDRPQMSRFRIARYARGLDYHDVVRARLDRAAEWLRGRYGGLTRVCVDTAPLRERYWAVRAGVGFIGRNNTLIVPGRGSFFVLGEILTTVPFEADEPCTLSCAGCMACVRACPAGALDGVGAVDARRCLSCQSIEHRGPFAPGVRLGGRIAGCDVCQDVCPHNRVSVSSSIGEFAPVNPLLDLTDEEMLGLTEADVRPLTRGTALSRIKPADLIRNIHSE